MASQGSSKVGKVLRHPAGWGGAGVLGLLGVMAFGSLLGVVGGVVAAVLGYFVYRVVMRSFARRETPELGQWRGVFPGMAVGAGFVLVSVLLVSAFGGYSFSWSSGWFGGLLSALLVSAGAAVTEELLFRGVVFQAVESVWGSWAALGATAVLFGAVHLGNPGASLWSAFAIAVEAGVLLGAAFLWRRDLWFAIGVHFAWNAAVGALGLPVSGHAGDGLFQATVSGPAFWTGGDFGIEASVVTVVVGLALAVPMLRAARTVPGRTR